MHHSCDIYGSLLWNLCIIHVTFVCPRSQSLHLTSPNIVGQRSPPVWTERGGGDGSRANEWLMLGTPLYEWLNNIAPNHEMMLQGCHTMVPHVMVPHVIQDVQWHQQQRNKEFWLPCNHSRPIIINIYIFNEWIFENIRARIDLPFKESFIILEGLYGGWVENAAAI